MAKSVKPHSRRLQPRHPVPDREGRCRRDRLLQEGVRCRRGVPHEHAGRQGHARRDPDRRRGDHAARRDARVEGAQRRRRSATAASSIMLYVQDVDAVFKRAAGGRRDLDRWTVADQFYGDRSGSLKDPFGHKWIDRDARRGRVARRDRATRGEDVRSGRRSSGSPATGGATRAAGSSASSGRACSRASQTMRARSIRASPRTSLRCQGRFRRRRSRSRNPRDTGVSPRRPIGIACTFAESAPPPRPRATPRPNASRRSSAPTGSGGSTRARTSSRARSCSATTASRRAGSRSDSLDEVFTIDPDTLGRRFLAHAPALAADAATRALARPALDASRDRRGRRQHLHRLPLPGPLGLRRGAPRPARRRAGLRPRRPGLRGGACRTCSSAARCWRRARPSTCCRSASRSAAPRCTSTTIPAC